MKNIFQTLALMIAIGFTIASSEELNTTSSGVNSTVFSEPPGGGPTFPPPQF